MYNTSPVDDTLLKKLSTETQLIGKQAIIKGWHNEPETQSVINNVIILPTSLFYRNQFMAYYELYNHNAVKALKELVINYPNIKDYVLDTGYVMRLKSDHTPVQAIKSRGEFMLMDDLATRRQDILKGDLKVVKSSRLAGSRRK